MFSPDAETSGVELLGAPIELVRTVSPKYVDQAQTNFAAYVASTLKGSMGVGGRYNPACEFGAVYCASDEDTAWREIAARFAREGVPGLPHEMGVLRFQIRQGYVVDLTDRDVVDAWGFDAVALSASDPDAAQQAHCRDVGRAVRPVADVLRAPSARGTGENVPVYADREGSDLDWELIQARVVRTPAHVRQRTSEGW